MQNAFTDLISTLDLDEVADAEENLLRVLEAVLKEHPGKFPKLEEAYQAYNKLFDDRLKVIDEIFKTTIQAHTEQKDTGSGK